MSKKLTLEERYFINMYSRRLPCTLPLRFTIDKFLNQIEITPEEIKDYAVRIDPTTLKFECNNSEYTVEYEKFPDEVINAMRNYIKMFEHEKNKSNEMLKKLFDYFRKII